MASFLKLGFEVAQSAVAKYMKRHVGPPGQSWWTILRNHMPESRRWSADIITNTCGSSFRYTQGLVWIKGVAAHSEINAVSGFRGRYAGETNSLGRRTVRLSSDIGN
jgi:hypothetical protein